jgi:hypothetical protein
VSGQQGQVATAYVTPADAGTLSLAGANLIDALRRATTGEYDVGGELGAGGMATVYLAHEIALGRKVAIKVMSPALLAMSGMVERFKREARTAASLSHPNIIPIYTVKQSQDVVFFVMKFIEGRSLESIVKAAGALPVPLVQAVLYQAAAALGHAHQAGVVHRDVKPANIMVDRDGWVVVTDFGIAKVAETTGLTMTGATIGTPSYMSPEQCEAKRELTGASDQYSLGIVAYEMLTGHTPFRAETTLGLLYAHVHEPPPPLGDDVPVEVADALMRMLEKDPARRFPDVESAIAALGGQPTGKDDPVREQLRQLARAGGAADVKRIASTPVSPLPATRGVTASSTRPRTAARPARPPTAATVTAQRAPRAKLPWIIAAAAVVILAAGAVIKLSRPAPALVPAPAPVAAPAPETVRVEVPVPAPAPAPAPATPPGLPATDVAVAPPSVPPPAPDEPALNRPVDQRTRRRFGVAKIAALGLRARARSRGATPDALAAGDAEARAADSLARLGDFQGANAALGRADQFYRTAASGVTTSSTTPGTATGPAAERAEVQAGVAAFAAAFKSRDLSRVRRVYPGMTPAQAQDWGTFFMDARNLDVRLSVADYDLQGDEIVAQVTGGLDWESLKTGRAESRTVAYRATFVRDKTGWMLTSIRE